MALQNSGLKYLTNANYLELLCRHVGPAFDKQLSLAELVAQLSWQLVLSSGFLSFADDHRWQVQILGAEAEESYTWLWAWADEASSILVRF